MKNILFSAFIILSLSVQAQWVEQATGFVAADRGANTITIVDTNTVWVTAIDGSSSTNYITEFSKTINGGASWSAGTINTGVIGAGIANISAIDGTTAWACIFHPLQTFAGGIWKTTDGGASWNKQTGAAYTASSFPNFVYFWDGNNGITVGDADSTSFEVYTTTDGGSTWVRTPNTGNQLSTNSSSEYGLTNSFSVIGGTLWFSTTKGRVFKTTDKGLTFTVSTVGNGLTAAHSLSFVNADTGYAFMNTPDLKSWRIAKTVDGGSTWLPVQNNTNENVTTILGADITAVPGTNSLISVGSDNNAIGSSISDDGGVTWYLLEDTSLAPPRISVRFLNSTTGWAGTFNQDQLTSGIHKFSGAVGIHDKTSGELMITIAPNPASDFIRIVNAKTESATYTLFNLTGEVIGGGQINGNYIDVSALPAGIYFIEIISEKMRGSDRFIKQ